VKKAVEIAHFSAHQFWIPISDHKVCNIVLYIMWTTKERTGNLRDPFPFARSFSISGLTPSTTFEFLSTTFDNLRHLDFLISTFSPFDYREQALGRSRTVWHVGSVRRGSFV